MNYATQITEPSKKMLKHFTLARNMANQNDTKFRHGAVLVSGGIVVNASTNSKRFCSFGARFRSPTKGLATLHAELGAILNIPRELTNNSDIYVVRVNQQNEFRNSAPCGMCQAALKHVGVKRVYYSTDGVFEMVKL
jgi:tRNA(Arg) A34 adenosine deaminase TadA